ncbi:MAG: DUF6443 domain-containing protein, partial [Bacteroidota bacterium]
GYYNGYDGPYNQSAGIPQEATITNHSPLEYTVSRKSNVRETDEASMLLGNLQKIKLPTGGSHEFEYKANEAHNYTHEYYEEVALDNFPMSSCPPCSYTGSLLITKTFVFRDDLRIKHSSGSTVCTPGAQLIFSIDNGPSITLNGPISGSLLKDHYPNLVPGNTYTIVFETASGPHHCYEDIQLYYEEVTPSHTVGGLRVKRTKAHTGMGQTVEKTYEYPHPFLPGESSGVLFNEPRYWGILHSPGNLCLDAGGQLTNYSHSYKAFAYNYSAVPLSGFEGNPIGYEKVIENHQGNGSKVYEYFVDHNVTPPVYPPYAHFPIDPNFLYDFPMAPTQANVKAGNPGAYRVLDQNGVDVPLEEIYTPKVESYSYSDPNVDQILKVIQVPFTAQAPAVFFTAYQIRTRPAYRLAKLERTQDGVKTTTEYEYTSPDHYFQTAEFMDNSDGKTHRTETKYAEDVGNADMITKHMVGIPLETRKYVDGAFQGGSKTKYEDYNGTNMVLPTELWQLFAGASGLRTSKVEYYTSGVNQGLPRYHKSYTHPGAHQEEYIYHTDADFSRMLQYKKYSNWTWEYRYYPNTRLLKQSIDIDGISTNYSYDDFIRLQSIGARNGQLLQSFKYRYTLAGGGMPNVIETYSGEDNITRHQYFDGLGRPLQTVAQQYSPDEKDVIHQAVEYDNYGRAVKVYHPLNTLVNTSGEYMPPNGFASNTCNYDVVAYENSPLNREIGRSFCDFGAISTAYGNGGGIQNVMTGGIYGPGELYRVDNTDENLHVTTTFTDKIGQLILTRRYESGQNIDTYNGYDDRGNLKEVLSPMSSTAGDLFSYSYNYDGRNRLTSKTLPNGVTSSYDYFDYDQIKTSTENGKQLWYQYNEYLQNTYVFTEDPTITGNTAYQTAYLRNDYDNTGGTKETGKVIQSMARNLHDVSQELFSQYNYDKLGRLQSTKTDTPLGFQEISETAYDGATDRVKGTLQLYQSEMAIELNVFDHAKRLTDQYFQSNISSGHISSNTYNY